MTSGQERALRSGYRKIALKLMHPEYLDDPNSTVRQRIQREACAMAKLSHPNVVQVYDVQTIEGDTNDLVIAMEFIDGRTLKAWLKEKTRSVKEILEVFIQAGEGLSAAHTAGLIHRDFKPDNVLVRKSDDRVFVTDFGLVVQVSEAPEAWKEMTLPASTSSPTLAKDLTKTGTLLGTPIYMSPEQYGGKHIDARSDQFSFCIALYEALYGERPFDGKSLQEIQDAVTSTQEVAVCKPKKGITRWIRQAVLRGLSKNPDQRFPSMRDLLNALRHDPLRKPRWIVLTTCLLVATASLAGFSMRSFVDKPVRCEVPKDEFAGVWDALVNENVKTAFLSSGFVGVEDTFHRVAKRLDAYQNQWNSAFVAACRDTHDRHINTPELLELRVACLREHRESVRVLTTRLSTELDRGVIDNALSATFALPQLGVCADIATLTAAKHGRHPEPTDPHVRRQLQDLSNRFREAELFDALGQFEQGSAIARDALAQSANLKYMPFVAKALYHQARFEERHGDYTKAEKTYAEAALIASSVHDENLHARSICMLAWVVGIRLERYDEALGMCRGIEGSVNSSIPNPADRTECLEAKAFALFGKGSFAEAISSLRQVVDVCEHEFGRDDPKVAKALHNLGWALFRAGQLDEAEAAYKRALDIVQRAFGDTHFLAGHELGNLGLILAKKGLYDDARRLIERSVEIETAAFGPDHIEVAGELAPLGEILLRQGQVESARTTFHRLLTILHRTIGADASQVGSAHYDLGMCDLAEGRARDAISNFESALAILERKPANGDTLAETRFALAKTLRMTAQDPARAKKLASQAKDTLAERKDAYSQRTMEQINVWLKNVEIHSN